MFQATQSTLNSELLVAARGRSTEGAAAALANKADVNARDVIGRTALHWAAIHAGYRLAVLLLDNGANLGAQDSSGETALDVAGDRRVFHLLKVSSGSAYVVDCTDPYTRIVSTSIHASHPYAVCVSWL